MTKLEKVYVITKGDYSDYHICAVTLDKERAKKLAAMYGSRWYEARIEEYVLDEEKKLHKYGVTFDLQGAFKRFCADEYDIYDEGLIDDYNSDETIIVWVKTKDEDHAIKIAQDKLAEYKAKKAGVCE